MRYIKTGIFDKQLSNIIKSAFSLRTESDYEDFYVIAKADVETQVKEADIFYHAISEYIHEKIKKKSEYDDNRTPILAVLKSSVWYRENGGCSVRGGRCFCCPNIFQMKGTYAYDRRAQEVPLMLRQQAAPGA